ncbi:hypothetical protein BaRGS_00040311, partial [Batillaria attramentaria]
MYTVKRIRKGVTHWRCSIRNKLVDCLASVRQSGDEFLEGTIIHCHPPTEGVDMALSVTAAVKKKCCAHIVEAASAITNEVLTELVSDNAPPLPCMPAPYGLARVGNRKRQAHRPRHPATLSFGLEEDHIPADFFCHDVVVEGRRHLVFARADQTELLANAKT